MKKGLIFDLDGVIVDTAHFHFLAWRKAAEKVGFALTPELNEKLKGVSRVDSLKKILEWANTEVSDAEFDRLAADKNVDFLGYVQGMTPEDILPGVLQFLKQVREWGHPIALGSASKNAPLILEKTGITHFFDAIVDGNSVSNAKPDPEVFLVAARHMKMKPEHCIVFEDSEAGVTAANVAGMTSVALGSPENLGHAHHVFSDFTEINKHFIQQLQP